MRQRRIRDLEEKTAAYSRFIVENPQKCRGSWLGCFEERFGKFGGAASELEKTSVSAGEKQALQGTAEQGRDAEEGVRWKPDIYLEIGCGKGKFLTTLAQRNPDNLYIGVEGAESVVLRALEKAGKAELKNVLFITQYIHDLPEFFGKGELAGIYLNFSDPWPKDRHARRRLTHGRYLQSYREVLPPGSFIEFKTDNDGLFAFSIPEFQANGMRILEQTDDLHKSAYASKEIETEYEHKFRLLGNKIHYCKVIV